MRSLTPFGWVNSLAQTLVKLTSPGIPDLYQGTSCGTCRWSIPTTAARWIMNCDAGCSRVKSASVEEVLKRSDEGLPKLWTIQRTLALRAQPGLFGPTRSEPLSAGSRADHVVAFMRGGRPSPWCRGWFQARLALGGQRCGLPAGRWRNHLTGDLVEGERRFGRLMARFPVCLLC